MNSVVVGSAGVVGPVKGLVTRVGRLPYGLYAALAVIAFFVLSAFQPAIVQTRDAFKMDLAAALQPPSAAHWLGTDQVGRDLYSRIIRGAGQSLALGFGAMCLSMAGALSLGVGAGLGGRLADTLISRFIDVLFAFPTLFLALLILAVFGHSITTEVVAIGFAAIPGYARIIRGQVLSVVGSAYVQAAVAVGHSYPRIVWQHVLPNALRPLVVTATLGIGQSIIWASGLAFLGLGAAPPSPEWGALLDAGRDYVVGGWWLEVMPGAAIVAFALSLTVAGRFLQDHLEGRSRR